MALTVFGRLPVKYRLTIWITGLLTFVLVGGWLGVVSPVTPPWQSMALVGAALGVMAVAAFVRVLEEHQPTRVRAHRRRHR